MRVEVVANNAVIARNGIGIMILLKKQTIMLFDMDIGEIFVNERLVLSSQIGEI
ncbi:MAG: hypothetical protein HDQ99_02745 [Lachnospiraceae bacterium]|nr:hypothetical protein [Lachnospiraceae bacterium]